jgi:hypothetical protein
LLSFEKYLFFIRQMADRPLWGKHPGFGFTASFFFTSSAKHWLFFEKQVICFFQSRENSKKNFTSVC